MKIQKIITYSIFLTISFSSYGVLEFFVGKDPKQIASDLSALQSALEIIDMHYGEKSFDIHNRVGRKDFFRKFRSSWKDANPAPLYYPFGLYLQQARIGNACLKELNKSSVTVKEFVGVAWKKLHNQYENLYMLEL